VRDLAWFQEHYPEDVAHRLHMVVDAAASNPDQEKANHKGWQFLNEMFPDPDEFIQNLFWITTTKPGELIRLKYNEGQRAFQKIVRDLEAKGQPVRVLCLKARQIGYSTWSQAYLNERVYRRPGQRATCIADEKGHAREIFQMGKTFRDHLLFHPEFDMKARD
jgi:hypothetical protein